MNFGAVKYLNHLRPRILRSFHNSLKRNMSDTKCEQPCDSTPPDPCPPKPASVPKMETCPPPQPPPCPPMPQCPPTICQPIPDPNNPCNYCPPPCIDPNFPDLTRLKKNQCRFQKDDGVPIYLKKGGIDVFLFQVTLILTFISVAGLAHSCYKEITK